MLVFLFIEIGCMVIYVVVQVKQATKEMNHNARFYISKNILQEFFHTTNTLLMLQESIRNTYFYVVLL